MRLFGGDIRREKEYERERERQKTTRSIENVRDRFKKKDCQREKGKVSLIGGPILHVGFTKCLCPMSLRKTPWHLCH